MNPPDQPLAFHVCPHCGRAVPASSTERYCPNDGQALLRHCPACHAPILSPYARFCTHCGHALRQTTTGGEI